MTRPAVLLGHPRRLFTIAALAALALLLVLMLSGGKATAGTAASDFAVLGSPGPSNLTAVSSAQEADAATGPIVDANGEFDVASAREAPVSVPGMRVWVAKGTGGSVCVLALKPQPADRAGPEGPASGCTPLGLLAHGVALEQFGPSGESYETAAVPDGVNSVTVSLTDGETQAVEVRDNVFSVKTLSPISTVTFVAEGTQETINVGGNR
jgi:hypothetical protein